jgi:lipopolysaccharide biosynthesis glycosyltransferase
MKIAFGVTCNDIYACYLKAFIRSIFKHNPDFNLDWFIYCDESLTDPFRKELLDEYSNFQFKDIDPLVYLRHGKGNIRFYAIEGFNIEGYDKVIHIGADCICMDSLDELFNEIVPSITSLGMTGEVRRPKTKNSNCMIIDKSLINSKVYIDLLNADFSERDDMYGTDQKLFGCYFEGKIQEVPQRYNVLVTEEKETPDPVFLHYIHKPLHPVGRQNLTDRQISIWESYK